MKVSEIDKDDCRKLADFLNSLRMAVGGNPSFSSMINFVDGVRWLQSLAINMAEGYAAQSASEAPKQEPEPFKVKTYNPGATE